MPDNYPSASEMPRNLSQIRTPFEVLGTEGKFRIVRFDPPYYEGYEFWVVNEKGFMWEGVDSFEAGVDYLATDEAKEYNAGP
ncbi:MAG: hypothetical protein ACO1SV_09015 [Fimbriimonas sp.]